MHNPSLLVRSIWLWRFHELAFERLARSSRRTRDLLFSFGAYLRRTISRQSIRRTRRTHMVETSREIYAAREELRRIYSPSGGLNGREAAAHFLSLSLSISLVFNFTRAWMFRPVLTHLLRYAWRARPPLLLLLRRRRRLLRTREVSSFCLRESIHRVRNRIGNERRGVLLLCAKGASVYMLFLARTKSSRTKRLTSVSPALRKQLVIASIESMNSKRPTK